jgi:uncharacterized membrane protein
VRTVLLGVVAGMRVQLPWALLAATGAANRFVRRGLLVAAAGELMLDKLPSAPSRTAPGPLGGRVVSGALAGGVLARRRGRSGVVGALLGGLGAGAGTFATHRLRAALGRSTAVGDRVLGVAEDLAALILGWFVVRAAEGQ